MTSFKIDELKKQTRVQSLAATQFSICTAKPEIMDERQIRLLIGFGTSNPQSRARISRAGKRTAKPALKP